MSVRGPFVWLEALLPPSIESQPQKTPDCGQGAGAAGVLSVSSAGQLCYPSLPSASPPHTTFSAWPWWVRLALVGRGLTAGGEEQLESPRQARTQSGAGRGHARPRRRRGRVGSRLRSSASVERLALSAAFLAVGLIRGLLTTEF